MKLLNTIGTLFMLAVTFILYAVFFHNRHIHPIGEVSKQIDLKMRCVKLEPLFREYEDKHEKARFYDEDLNDAGITVGNFQATYIMTLTDQGMFGNPELTVYCDNNRRVLKYTLESQ